jgi:exoribonuclease II
VAELSIKQMANRRRLNRITRRQVQDELGCSYSWVRWLEDGMYQGPALESWAERYRDALEGLLVTKRAHR